MWKHGPSVTDSDIRIAVSVDSDLTLGHVRKIFGAETRTVLPVPPSHPTSGGYMPSTPYGIAYEKKVYPAGTDRPYRMTAEFSAEGNFHGMALLGPKPDRLPDRAKVTFISLKVIVE